jgi:hypothetical protein
MLHFDEPSDNVTLIGNKKPGRHPALTDYFNLYLLCEKSFSCFQIVI